MNISATDLALIFASALAIILLSFILPTVGLADANNETAESDIPEFNLSANTFNVSRDGFPDSPGQPSKGTVTYDDQAVNNGDNRIALNQTLSAATHTELTAANFSIAGADPDTNNVRVIVFNSGTAVSNDAYNFSAVGDTAVHTNNSWEVTLEATEYNTSAAGDPRMTIAWEIVEQPRDSGFLGRIPVVGGILDTADAVASVLAYIGSIIFWGVGTVIETVLNFGSAGYQTILYFVGLLQFMLNTYNSLITASSSGWATVLVSVPGILFALEFTKLAAVSLSELAPG